jgi:hypothetical protein
MLKPTRNEEAQVAVAQDGSNTDQTRTTTRHNAHILPRVLALSPLAVVFVVQLCNSLSQWSDASRWAILSAMRADVHLFWPLKASLYAVVNLGRTLAQVGPLLGLLEKSVLVRLFRGPHNTCGCTGGVETSVGLVPFVRAAELPVGARVDLCLGVSAWQACACGMGSCWDWGVRMTRLESRGNDR